MSESVHDKLKRVRKPRVHITYDVETNGAIEKKELPFVVGVMGDYSGDNTDGKKSVKDRKFVQVDRDNINEAMTKVNPQLNFKVDNTLGEEGSEMGVDLEFKTLEDFEPHKVVDQVDPLKKLLETRNKLRDLMTKVDRSEDLENILEEVLQNTESLANLSEQLGVGKDEEGSE